MWIGIKNGQGKISYIAYKNSCGYLDFCIYGIFIYLLLLGEPTTNASPYDEMLITPNDEIEITSTNIMDIQSEISQYVGQWKETKHLLKIVVFLDENLSACKIIFYYFLDDIENYSGYLEVLCTKSDHRWEIWTMRSEYYEGDWFDDPLFKNRYATIEDSDLQAKIDTLIKYINAKERLCSYRIQIEKEDIEIRAGDLESGATTDRWTEFFRTKKIMDRLLYLFYML